MNKKITIPIIMLTLIGLAVFVSAVLTRDDFETFDFYDGLGTVKESDIVTFNIQKGWNLVPLKYISEASGYKWMEGNTCEEDVFQNVWMYSPAEKNYYHIPVIDDWVAPKTRGNDFLLREFQAKYYHVYAGSAWLYSGIDCTFVAESGVQLVSGTYNDEMQGKSYSYEELVLKAGWNFVPINMRMVAYEKSLKELFKNCGAEKYYVYDKSNNKWIDVTIGINGEGNKLNLGDIFGTIVVKTNQDCYFADFDESSDSSPPALP